MSTIQLELPDHLLAEAEKFAAEEQIPVRYYISRLVRRDIAARQGLDYLKQRAARADRKRFLEILDKAPDVPPMPGDEIE